MTILILLTTAGADTGPFSLYSDVDGYTVPFETNVAKIDLITLPGYLSSLVPDDTTIIKVASISDICTNYVLLTIPTISTTTTTTTVLTVPVIFNDYPPTDEGSGANPRVEYWSSSLIGGLDDAPAIVELTATEVSHTGGSGQLYISIDPEADFSLKAWAAMIGFGGVNPYTVNSGIPIYFQVIAGSSPGDTTTIEVEITSVNISTIGTPYILTLTSTT